MATVKVDNIEGGITVGVTPRNPDARAFGWTDFPDEMILGIGDHGGRWELGAGAEDVALLRDIARSVIAGRVREVFAPGRSAVSVTLADGSVETEVGGEALDRLPAATLLAALVPQRPPRPVQHKPVGASVGRRLTPKAQWRPTSSSEP